MGKRGPQPASATMDIDGVTVYVDTIASDGDRSVDHRRTSSYTIRAGNGASLGVVYRIDHGEEPHYVDERAGRPLAAHSWFARRQTPAEPFEPPVLEEATGAYPSIVAAVTALVEAAMTDEQRSTVNEILTSIVNSLPVANDSTGAAELRDRLSAAIDRLTELDGYLERLC
jgi:hypothetical protein